MFLAIWKANRRLRGSLSPSIDWTNPKTKSAPRPFSSEEKEYILIGIFFFSLKKKMQKLQPYCALINCSMTKNKRKNKTKPQTRNRQPKSSSSKPPRKWDEQLLFHQLRLLTFTTSFLLFSVNNREPPPFLPQSFKETAHRFLPASLVSMRLMSIL